MSCPRSLPHAQWRPRYRIRGTEGDGTGCCCCVVCGPGSCLLVDWVVGLAGDRPSGSLHSCEPHLLLSMLGLAAMLFALTYSVGHLLSRSRSQGELVCWQCRWGRAASCCSSRSSRLALIGCPVGVVLMLWTLLWWGGACVAVYAVVWVDVGPWKARWSRRSLRAQHGCHTGACRDRLGWQHVAGYGARLSEPHPLDSHPLSCSGCPVHCRATGGPSEPTQMKDEGERRKDEG